jgi:hypothetical protein
MPMSLVYLVVEKISTAKFPMPSIYIDIFIREIVENYNQSRQLTKNTS